MYVVWDHFRFGAGSVLFATQGPLGAIVVVGGF